MLTSRVDLGLEVALLVAIRRGYVAVEVRPNGTLSYRLTDPGIEVIKKAYDKSGKRKLCANCLQPLV